MMNGMQNLKWALGLSVAALVVAGCAPRSGGNVAVVNGEPITEEEFNEYLQVKPEVQIVTANGELAVARVADTLAFQALQDLIRQKVILQLAKDRKIFPTEEDVRKEVDFQRRRDPQFIQALLDRGLTLDQIRQSLRVDLSRERLLTSDIKIDIKEVEEYIKENPERFTEPASVDARWIYVTEERQKAQVERLLNAGQTFTTVAIQESQAPNASQTQGAFPRRYVPELPQQLRDLFAKTQEGEETGWVRIEDGWAKFLVESKRAERKIEMTDVQKEWLRRNLMVQRGIQSKDLDRALVKKLQDAKIDVTPKHLAAPWKAAMEQLESAAKQEAQRSGAQSPTATGTGR